MTKAVAGILGLAGAITIFLSCKKQDDAYPSVPEITYKGMNKAQINAAIDTGDWYLYYDFVDGDGNLGSKIDDAEMRVFLTNTKTGAEYKFPFPYIPRQDRSGKKYLKGYGNIKLNIPAFFQLRPGIERDTTTFTLYIIDEAGNQSNVITTEPVIIYR